MAELVQLLSVTLSNDLFLGGLALGTFGVAAAVLRSLLGALARTVARRARVSLTLDNRSPAYRHFCLWMEHHGVLSRARHLRLTDAAWAKGTQGHAPAPGRHWFLWRGRLCRLDRTLEKKARIGPSHDPRPLEVLTITILFGRVGTILDWIAEGAQIARGRDRIGPGLHVLRDGYWDHVGDVTRRPLETVLVDDDRITRLADDMRWFYEARDWYAARGVPWRRGYLFHGPPGTGKSSLIRALASDLSLDIATLDIGRATLSDDDLREALTSAPARTLIAIEDVDAVFRKRAAGERGSGVSFSGLLNAIDGVSAQEGRALVMTTNHKDRLDAALVRPGRADVHLELGRVSAPTARRLFERFFPGEAALACAFERALGDRRVSPAQVQGWLLAHSTDAAAAARATGLTRSLAGVAAE